MSLQNIAQHLSNQGRGKDTTLVHMTPNEVSGLAALARSNGKEISVNPQTGLPDTTSVPLVWVDPAIGPALSN